VCAGHYVAHWRWLSPRLTQCEGALNDDNVRRLSVCLSVASRAYVRLIWQLSNQSTWKFRTML